jgi:hypothetical protein
MIIIVFNRSFNLGTSYKLLKFKNSNENFNFGNSILDKGGNLIPKESL